MPACRLLLDGPADGAWNMAVDEVLLGRAARHGEWTLRLYGWAEPTVSLGYFQPMAARDSHAPSRRCPVVRRPSGGGAIVHDREITYSLTAPVGRAPDAGRQLYWRVHRAMVDLLTGLGIPASLCQPTGVPHAAGEPFLCFQRRAEGDVLLGDAKIVGSAQRRFQNAVLQHGSLLLEASPAAPELPGVETLTRLNLTIDAWRNRLGQVLRDGLSLQFTPGRLDEADYSASVRIAQEKYRESCWNSRK